MSAIRNVGELATPYFLLEVWTRRHDIDIDPETYATLKRKTRRLVRDARGFELRGEACDDQWTERRREILALEQVTPRTVQLEDGREHTVGIVSDDSGEDILIIDELAELDSPDDRPEDALDPPSTRFELALDAYDGSADWAMLLTGLELRVYRRSSGVSQQYLAVDLDTLVELDDEPQWKAFAGIFRRPAFVGDEEGVPLIRRVVDESRRHAAQLAEDMRADVIHAAEALMQGALSHPDNRDHLDRFPDRAQLHELFEQTLYYLYRILFALYAEGHDVFPLAEGGPYATTYSVDHLVERARSERSDLSGTYYHHSLARLFDLLWDGPADRARRLGIEPVGGELFDPTNTTVLDACTIDDVYWRKAFLALAVGAPGTKRRQLGRRSSFAELGVDQLGSIYEGLLVLEPFVAGGNRALVLIDGERRVVKPDAAEGRKLLRTLVEGDVVLESASGRRKGSGSFYTPAEITEYLSRKAIDPLVDEVLADADNPDDAAERILDLRVCDPAMGSGAFLVQAVRVLGTAVARARAMGGDRRVTPAMINRGKRQAVRRCVYGVDLNPLAVALAKVSLWLETLEPGRPLSFLDAHLRCGDSLVGIDFETHDGHLRTTQLATWPAKATKGLETYLKNEAGETGKSVLDYLKRRRAPRKAQQAQLPGTELAGLDEALRDLAAQRAELGQPANGETLQLTFEAAEIFAQLEADETSLRNRLRRAADFWCAQWFWRGEDALPYDREPVLPPVLGDFEQILAAILAGETLATGLERIRSEADHIAKQRRFFHWALEFPEVIIHRGGFDAVIGNPPWNTLSPDDTEFFATYDPDVFRQRGGPTKAVKEARKDELRSFEDIDLAWRQEARFLHQLSYYAKPEAGRFQWYAPEGNLRKGDSNVFRLFVERAYKLLRTGGRMAQVLPDSFYVSSPATGLRQQLLTDGQLHCCFAFENKYKIFPIHSGWKISLMSAERGNGPTKRFQAAFFSGSDALGESRAISLDELPTTLADIDDHAPLLSLEQIRGLSPETWSFPELQTDLDAEITAQIVREVACLNLDDDGWNLTYCRELDADRDAWRFRSSEDLKAKGALRDGLRWVETDGTEWWPLVEGDLIYHLEFPMKGKDPELWVHASDVRSIAGRLNEDGTSTMDHYRFAWRDVTAVTNERTAVAAVIPPRTSAKHTAPTVWGGSKPPDEVLLVAALVSSLVFDYMARFKGFTTHLTHSTLNSIPAPSVEKLRHLVPVVATVVCSKEELRELATILGLEETHGGLDTWDVVERRARIDGEIALAYGLSLEQYAAVLSTFPALDRVQPMLPGEPKSFVTRDLALQAYCDATDTEPPDVVKLLRSVGVRTVDPRPGYERLDDRVAAARELGAVPYRPTPPGGRPPSDPWLVGRVRQAITQEPRTAGELADAVEARDEEVVKRILKDLVGTGEAFKDGRGKSARFYVLEG